MNQTKIFKEFKKAVARIGKKFKSPTDLFMYLGGLGHFTRLELMVVDSAVKNMPLEYLHNTLLLKQDSYLNLLQSLTARLITESKLIKNQ